MYDVRRLRILREVSLRGTLAATAEALGYNPSSVSHQLRALEREVGVPLLEPVGRGVRLTQEALILVRHTEDVLRSLESAESEIALAAGLVRGTVRLACFQTAAHTVVPDALLTLREEHPDLHVRVSHISVEAALPALLARDFDLVMGETYPGDAPASIAGVEVSTLGLDPLWLLPPAGIPADRFADLADADWVMEPPGTQARRWSEAECRRAGFDPRVVVETSDVMLHVRLATQGLAAALVPGLALAGSTAAGKAEKGPSSSVEMDGRHRVVPLPGRPMRRITVAVRRGAGHAPAVDAVRSALARHTAARLAEVVGD